MSVNRERKESTMFKVLSQILTEELSNVNISYPTVTGVKLSNDQSHAKVYVTFMNNEQKSLQHLIRSKGFIRTVLAKNISMRKVPNLVFEIDETAKKGQRIDEILTKIKMNTQGE